MFEISKGIIAKAQKVVIYGPEGIGKSTFASKFPNPLFIDIEGSTNNMNVRRLPTPSSWSMLLQEIDFVKQNTSELKTLVIDTADWAEQLALEHICSLKQVKGIEDIGYGRGYVYLLEEFGRFLNKLTELINLGINVVITAHAQMRKFEQPDELGAYDRWELKLQKKTSPLLKEWADMLLFANYKTIVVNVDNQGASKGKNKVQGGKRVMYTQHHPCWDAKNRNGLDGELEFDFSKIMHIFVQNFVGGPVRVEDKIEYKNENIGNDINQKVEQVNNDIKQNQEINSNLPKQLQDLLKSSNVTEKEVRQIAFQKGYYPLETPIEKYDNDFIQGWVIGHWDKIVEAINQERFKKDTENLPFY